MVNLSGAFIAPATPVKADGQVDYAQFELLLNFLMDGGVDGVCIGGGTAEYPRFGLEDRCRLISAASGVVAGRGRLVTAIGASSFSETIHLGRHAEKEEPDALLLPGPHFFRYQQHDLEHFCRQVSRALSTPILLYNLPGFTNAIEPETALRLLTSEPNLVGVKDSSGDKEALHIYRDGRQGHEFSLLMGMDPMILDSLDAGWDGSISGLGNLCPELLSALLRNYRQGNLERARQCQEVICRIADEFDKLPVPWGVRAGLQVRGFDCGPTAIPPSPERAAQIKEFQTWFERILDSELKAAIRPAELTVA